MSRSGYCDDGDNGTWGLICWRGAVKSSIKGARGQQFLRNLLASLDAMPEKVLVAGDLEREGQFCALGVAGQAAGLNLAGIDTYDWDVLSKTFSIAEALAREIMYVNDEIVRQYEWVETGEPYPNKWKRVEVVNAPARRWQIVRDWVAKQIVEVPHAALKEKQS